MRIAACAFGALPGLAVVAWSAAGVAVESEVVVAVDCPALGTEQRAALESRAQAELLVRRETGTFVVACAEGRARLTWHSARGVSPESSVQLAAEAPASVDRVLEEFDRLLNAAADVGPLPAGGDPASASAGPTAAAAAPEPAPPAAPNVGAGGASSAWRGVSGAVGVSGELWSASAPAALGPCVRVEVAVPDRIALDIGGSLWWTLRAPEGVQGSLVRIHAGALYEVDDARRFRIGAMGFVDWLQASPNTSLAAVSHTVPGAALHAGYAFGAAPFRLVTGPTLSGRLGSVRVERGGHDVFSLPAVAVGWTVEGLFGPF